MKKILTILIIAIITVNSTIPIYVLAGAPEEPPELPEWYRENYCKDKTTQQCLELVNEELKDKEIKQKSPKRKAPANPYAFGLSVISTYIISQSEYASELEDKFWEKIDEIDISLADYLADKGIHGWSDLFTTAYEGYGVLEDKIKDLIRSVLPETEIVHDINSLASIHPVGKELLEYARGDIWQYEREYWISPLFFTKTNFNDKVSYIANMAIGGWNSSNPTMYKNALLRKNVNGHPLHNKINHGYYDVDKDLPNGINAKAFHDNLQYAKDYVINYMQSSNIISMYEYYFAIGEPMPDVLSPDRIFLPSHVPNIHTEHFPSLPDKTLFNPDDYSIVEVDGVPYLEINYVPNAQPVPALQPTTPYLIPLQNPARNPVIPVFPEYDPNTNPDFNPNPNPEPEPDLPPGDLPDDCGQLKLDLKSIELFTTKFPFSIPWDIYRALEAFFGKMGSEEPRFVLSFISNDVVLELPQFIKEWVPLVRTLILFVFDISIIYALYRWFGGAT